ncbi:hypothetical protein, partial [Deinococcus murrayi]|uniref:hypothetical protein n=1 Tax=Deinococcus murrayi TaxID=68910 RepID=UPI001B7F9536
MGDSSSSLFLGSDDLFGLCGVPQIVGYGDLQLILATCREVGHAVDDLQLNRDDLPTCQSSGVLDGLKLGAVAIVQEVTPGELTIPVTVGESALDGTASRAIQPHIEIDEFVGARNGVSSLGVKSGEEVGKRVCKPTVGLGEHGAKGIQ